MSYIALYRKYRPNTFENIVGQENITKILKNQIKSDKISHAYIFSGGRGTGKTSAAKVLSRAINCLNPKDGEPCNECTVCKGILDGSITDVIEMDAASNNSVENIRQIRQEVIYATIDVKYRVYIIDEVHMLTTSAFNALLKTLEEPPENVVFILATTEQHKIPVTILSRCLKFEFNQVPIGDIIKRLEYVLNEEKTKYEDKALEYIAKLSEGALRDSLSILDRCLSESKDVLKYEDIVRIVGAIDEVLIKEIVDNIYNLNSIATIEIIDEIIKKGKNLRQLISQLIEEFLNKLIIDNNEDKLDKKRIIYIIDKLSKLDNYLKETSKPAIILKAYIIELCDFNYEDNENKVNNNENNNNKNNVNLDLMNKKIVNLEEQINNLNEKIKDNVLKVNLQEKSSKENTDNVDKVELDKKEKLMEFKEIEELKKEIVQKGKLKVFSALASSKIYISKETVLIITQNKFAYNILASIESKEVINEVLKEKYNIEKNLIFQLQENEEKNINKIEEIFKENDINYTPID
jgi:DNA polymerase-3 subunit gamma/tau